MSVTRTNNAERSIQPSSSNRPTSSTFFSPTLSKPASLPSRRHVATIETYLYHGYTPARGDRNVSIDVVEGVRGLKNALEDSNSPPPAVFGGGTGLRDSLQYLEHVQDAKYRLLEALLVSRDVSSSRSHQPCTRFSGYASQQRRLQSSRAALRRFPCDLCPTFVDITFTQPSKLDATFMGADASAKVRKPKELLNPTFRFDLPRANRMRQAFQVSIKDATSSWERLRLAAHTPPGILSAPYYFFWEHYHHVYLFLVVLSGLLTGLTRGVTLGALIVTILVCVGIAVEVLKNSLDVRRADSKSTYCMQKAVNDAMRKLVDRVLLLLVAYEELCSGLRIVCDGTHNIGDLTPEEKIRLERVLLFFDDHYNPEVSDSIRDMCSSVRNQCQEILDEHEDKTRSYIRLRQWVRRSQPESNPQVAEV